MMSPRERVLAVYAHEEPDRVPIWCGMSDGFRAKARRHLGIDDEGLLVRLGDDFRRVWPRYRGPNRPLLPNANSCTVFGVYHGGVGWGQPLSHPLADATTLDEIAEYPWPDPAWMDVSNIRSDAQAWGGRYAILGGDASPFWHDAIDLVGMENLFLRMYDTPELADAVLARTAGYYLATTRRIFDAAADAIDLFFFANDFGSQTGPLLGEGLFRRFLMPHLKRFIDLGHDYGLKVQMHCCGSFVPLIPALIEAGLDGVQAVQGACCGMDLARLKREFGHLLVFNGAIDSHHVLIDGTPALVREVARDVLRIMMPGGGYVASATHDAILEETPVENVLAMCDSVREFGVYGPRR